MTLAACFLLALAVGAMPDVSQLIHFAFPQNQTVNSDQSAPKGTLPSPAVVPPADKQPEPARGKQTRHAELLSESSRLAIIRAISGEYVRAQVPLPGGKDGFHLIASGPQAQNQQDEIIASSPILTVKQMPVIHKGDKVQITRIQFRDKSIVLDLNGGGKQHWHLGDHLQVGVAGPFPVASDQPVESTSRGLEGQGSTLFLDFGHKLPDLSPDQVKLKLAPVLDFSRERSAAAQYAQSLPPEFQQAIKNRVAAVGMDHDMVLAAMGRPDRKIREKDADGNDTEDWIYGAAPGKIIFVTFIGEKAVRVRQFN